MTAIRLVVVDDERLVREGLVLMLQAFPEFQVVATAGSGTAALAEVAAHRPHLVVVDVPVPGPPSLDTVRRLRRAHPFVRVVVLTSNQQPAYVREAFAAGANAYLSRQIGAEELRRSLVTVHREGAELGTGVAVQVLQLLAGRAAAREASPVGGLTERERQILFLVAEDHGTEPIARRLGISAKTVRNHLSSIYTKLGTPDRVQTTLYAKRHFGLVHDLPAPPAGPGLPPAGVLSGPGQ